MLIIYIGVATIAFFKVWKDSRLPWTSSGLLEWYELASKDEEDPDHEFGKNLMKIINDAKGDKRENRKVVSWTIWWFITPWRVFYIAMVVLFGKMSLEGIMALSN